MSDLQIPAGYCVGTDVAFDPLFDKASPFTVTLPRGESVILHCH